MNWETFYLDSSMRNVDIVLNPIIKSKFNNYRSPTKFFDTTRLGAVGIYSKMFPYASFVKDNYLLKIKRKNIEIHARSIFLQGLLLRKNVNLPKQFRKNKFFYEWE